MADLSLQFILELVDRLSGPAKEAANALGLLDDVSKSMGAGGGDLQAAGWVEAGRAIGAAAEATRQYTGAAAEAVKSVDPIVGVWERANQQINYSTRSVDEFAAASRRAAEIGAGGAHGGGGRGAHEGSFGGSLETAADLGLMIEAPKAIEETWAAGAHLSDETIAQRIAGMSPKEIEFARSEALDLQAQFPQFALDKILEQTREARAILNTDEEAREALPDYLRAAALQDRAHPGQGLDRANPLMRAIEEAGAPNTPGRTHEMFDAFQKAMNVFGENKIPPHFFQDVFQHAGMFGRGWDMEFVRDKLPHLVASLGGDATGTMLATLGMAVKGGHVMGPALRAFDELGLLDESKVHRKKSGQIDYIDPNAIQGGDILGRDPMDWVNEKLWAAIQKKTSDPTEQDALLAVALSNRNDLKAGYMAIHDTPGFVRDKNLIEPNVGLAGADMLKDDALVGWQALKSSLETLASIASDPLMEPVAHGLDTLSGAISRFAKSLDGHPAEQTALTLGFTGGLAWAGWKAFTGMGSALGSWLGVGGGAGAAAAEGGGAAAAGGGAGAEVVGGVLAGASRLLGGLGAAVYELAYPHSWLNDTMRDALAHAQWSNPTHEFDWRDPGQRDIALNQQYARQADEHPILHGERDMEAARAHAYGELAGKAKEAADDLKALGQTVTPKVDSGLIDILLAKLREAASLIGSINGGLAGASARASAPLHDGPEAH